MQPQIQNWQSLAQALRDCGPDVALRCQFPASDQHLSLLESLHQDRVAADQEQSDSGKLLYQQLTGLLNQLSAFQQISRCPILGITGLLNSGKSSLLTTYLSQHGRQRVLRGLSSLAGTHRFVLWLPQRWQVDSELTQPLMTFLSQLFGQAPENLSEDPELAARQYNGHIINASSITASIQPISVPLIAFDSGLNDLQLGLLDCPDIQTGFADSRHDPQSEAQERQRWLAAIGRLCAAFIVMTKLGSLHDQVLLDILTLLRDAMPGVPRILTVNRVKSRYSPEVVAQQAQALVDRFGISSVYVAYDFRSALAETRIPPTPQGMSADADGRPQPVFFQASVNEPVQPVSGSDNPRYLFHLGQQLDVGILARESNRSLVQQLKICALKLLAWHERNPTIRHQQIVDAWQTLANACYEFMAERDSEGKYIGLRLQTSPAIIAQLSDSLRRTAPLWMKPSLSIDKTARQLQQAIAARTEKLKLMQSASQAVTDFVKRFRRGEGAQIVTPQTVARAIRRLDLHEALRAYGDQQLTRSCEQGLLRFSAEDQPLLDPTALDQWSQTIWSNMSLTTKLRRGVQPLALVSAPLLAALLVPFDGGGSAVLVFASAKELLAAAGVAAVVTPLAGGGQTIKIIQEETPWRQLSDLFAILCDCLGLPRPTDLELPSCGISHPRKLFTSQTVCRPNESEQRMNVWRPVEGSLARLQSIIQRC